MPPSTVSALPLELLDLPGRTGPTDDGARLAAAPLDGLLAAAGGSAGLGAAVIAHVARSEVLGATTAITGLAILVAGGAAGALVLALRATGASTALDADAVADVLALALGLPAAPGTAVNRPDVDPRVVAALAAVLGHDVLARIAESRPHLVGPVDGMPIALRYAANRELARRAGLTELAGPDRQLLYLDPVRGHAAEVVGDLEGADHVAVVVPGMGNSLAHFDTVLAKAEALRRAAADLDPPEEVAAVAWLGYDSPTVDVIVDDEARSGAPHLVRFVDGMVAGGVPAAATLTVIGHSYGTVVAGQAMRGGLDVDAVAVTGSPGMGAGSASDLGTVPIYALRAPGDYVSWTEHFGTDPTEPDFGATRLATGDVVGHSGYFDDGTVAIANLAFVATGRAGDARRQGTSWFEHGVDVIDDARDLTVDRPTDATQAVINEAAGVLSDATDWTESVIPDPAAGALDDAQDVAGATLEVGNRGVDFVQRLATPDLPADIVEDVWDWATG